MPSTRAPSTSAPRHCRHGHHQHRRHPRHHHHRRLRHRGEDRLGLQFHQCRRWRAINALAVYATDAYATGNNTNITFAVAGTGAATLNNTFRFNANQASTLTIGAAFGVQGTAVGLQAGGILVTPNVGAFATIINGAALQRAAGTVNFDTIVHQHNTLGALQIDSVIQNNTLATAQGLTKTGAGKLFLNANNTYSGFVNLYEVKSRSAAPPPPPPRPPTPSSAVRDWPLTPPAGSSPRAPRCVLTSTNTNIYNGAAFNGEGKIIMDVDLVPPPPRRR